MNTTITISPSAEGYSTHGFRILGVSVPPATIVSSGIWWTPTIEGQPTGREYASVCERSAFHRAIKGYLIRHGVNPPLRFVFSPECPDTVTLI